MTNEEKIYTEIESRYNLSFLDELKRIEGIQVFVFGGMLRDFLIGSEWKEIDLRIVLNKTIEEREAEVEKALAAYNLQGKTRIDDLNLTVYRFLPADSKTDEPIDLSVIPTINDNLPDFTVNSIFFDVVNKKIVDRFHGVIDIDLKQIATVNDPDQRFTQEPHMMFRAIKFACQKNFDISSETMESIRHNAPLVKKTFSFISEAKKGIFVELFLGNIFKGLKSDPKRYFMFIKDLGIYEQFVAYASEKLSVPMKQAVFPENTQGTFESNISYLFSCIVNSLNVQDFEESFKFLTADLAITTPKEYTDFVITISAIGYQPTN